jgi:hypothetical protein
VKVARRPDDRQRVAINRVATYLRMRIAWAELEQALDDLILGRAASPALYRFPASEDLERLTRKVAAL